MGALTRSTAWSDPVDNVRDKVAKSPTDNAKTCTQVSDGPCRARSRSGFAFQSSGFYWSESGLFRRFLSHAIERGLLQRNAPAGHPNWRDADASFSLCGREHNFTTGNTALMTAWPPHISLPTSVQKPAAGGYRCGSRFLWPKARTDEDRCALLLRRISFP
jgi:hypothetical protein